MCERFLLNELEQNQTGEVRKILSEPEMKRRFQDIGLICGTKVTCVGKGPFGDPKAYEIRAQSLRSEIAMRSRSKYVQKEFQRRVCKADGKAKRNDNRTGRESECGKKYTI